MQSPNITASAEFPPTAQAEVVELLRRRIAECELGCMGREVADQILDGIGAEGERLSQIRGLAEARQMRDAIVSVMRLLSELDELEPDEPDRSVFYEIADLFEDVATIARSGALAAQRAGGNGNG